MVQVNYIVSDCSKYTAAAGAIAQDQNVRASPGLKALVVTHSVEYESHAEHLIAKYGNKRYL